VQVYKDSRVMEITIETTPAMDKLISQFDEGMIPELVLND
jgi:hypothetical protein